jgi:hypothetical protein
VATDTFTESGAKGCDGKGLDDFNDCVESS